jgi:hypothetical protein
VSSPSLWRLLNKFADAYPDGHGQNTAISSAIDVKFVRTFIVHPKSPAGERQTASRDDQLSR